MNTTMFVMSRKQLERYNSDGESVAIISITDPDRELVKLACVAEGVLRLQFHDIDVPSLIYKLMTTDDADDVADFCLKWWGNVSLLIVQCEGGISRSAGVAAAIAKHFRENDTIYFDNTNYYPNRYCYRLVLDSLEESDAE